MNNEIDRAYVLTSPEQMDILFSRGELGNFGERTENYAGFTGCSVNSEDMEILLLVDFQSRTVIETDGFVQITDKMKSEEYWDLFFLRVGTSFTFVDAKPYYREQ